MLSKKKDFYLLSLCNDVLIGCQKKVSILNDRWNSHLALDHLLKNSIPGHTLCRHRYMGHINAWTLFRLGWLMFLFRRIFLDFYTYYLDFYKHQRELYFRHPEFSLLRNFHQYLQRPSVFINCVF